MIKRDRNDIKLRLHYGSVKIIGTKEEEEKKTYRPIICRSMHTAGSSVSLPRKVLITSSILIHNDIIMYPNEVASKQFGYFYELYSTY